MGVAICLAAFLLGVLAAQRGVTEAAHAPIPPTPGVTTGLWPLAAVLALVLGPMLVAVLSWTVTVDRTGFTARSGLRWPTLHVLLDEVEHAEVVTVRPVRDFGGFGLRTAMDGRTGAVLRPDPALKVHRSEGRVMVVTVDDAQTGAALLNTLAARTRQVARGRSGGGTGLAMWPIGAQALHRSPARP